MVSGLLDQSSPALGGGWLANTGDTPRPADIAPDWGNVDKNGTPIETKVEKKG